MRVVSESSPLETLPLILQKARTRPVEILDGDEVGGAIISKDDLEIVRKARAEKGLACDG
jgi:hypothetical protein